MKTNPAQKGFKFEREMAKKFSLWLTEGEDAYAVERRAGSGGSKRDKEGKSGHSGDLFSCKESTRRWFEWNHVELKHYKDLTRELWKWQAGEDCLLSKWLGKAIKEALAAGKQNTWLVIKSNRLPVLYVFTDRDSDRDSDRESKHPTAFEPIEFEPISDLFNPGRN